MKSNKKDVKKPSSSYDVSESDEIDRIEEEEKTKYANQPNNVLQERLEACIRNIAQAKKDVLEFEARANALRKILGKITGQGDTMWFSICPMCETIHVPEVNRCSKCGFTEYD